MILRQLGLYAQELETGPLTFLLSHGIPVAYRDRRPEAMRPGLFRSDAFFSKSTTAHVNKWLKTKGLYATIPHGMIVDAFNGLSRYDSVRNETEVSP